MFYINKNTALKVHVQHSFHSQFIQDNRKFPTDNHFQIVSNQVKNVEYI